MIPTSAQLRLLVAIERCSAPEWPADGWGEVYTHFDEARRTPGPLAMATFDRIGDACKRRGGLVDGEDVGGVALTDAGREVLRAAGKLS